MPIRRSADLSRPSRPPSAASSCRRGRSSSPRASAPTGGVPRALCIAAGVRPGDIVHNTFAYHLTPGGWIMDAGARALGCAVIPAGPGNTEQQLEAIPHLKPTAYVGVPDYLKILLDKAAEAGKDASSIKKALVSGGALFPSLRAGVRQRGIAGRPGLRHRRCRPDRLREPGSRRRRRGHDRRRRRDPRDRAARHRRSGAGRRGRRGRRHRVQSRLSDDPPRDRRSVGRAAGR